MSYGYIEIESENLGPVQVEFEYTWCRIERQFEEVDDARLLTGLTEEGEEIPLTSKELTEKDIHLINIYIHEYICELDYEDEYFSHNEAYYDDQRHGLI